METPEIYKSIETNANHTDRATYEVEYKHFHCGVSAPLPPILSSVVYSKLSTVLPSVLSTVVQSVVSARRVCFAV